MTAINAYQRRAGILAALSYAERNQARRKAQRQTVLMSIGSIIVGVVMYVAGYRAGYAEADYIDDVLRAADCDQSWRENDPIWADERSPMPNLAERF